MLNIPKELQPEADKLVAQSVELSSKLTAILAMFENYYAAQTQNEIEINKFSYKAIEQTIDPDNAQALKNIRRVMRNKQNAIENKEKEATKFVRRFSKDLSSAFKDDTTVEALLDAFDMFWSTHVELKEEGLAISREALGINDETEKA